MECSRLIATISTSLNDPPRCLHGVLPVVRVQHLQTPRPHHGWLVRLPPVPHHPLGPPIVRAPAQLLLQSGDALAQLHLRALQLPLVPLEARLEVLEEGGAVAGVAHAHRALADIAREVQVVLLAALERLLREGVQAGRGEGLGVGEVVAAIGRPVLAGLVRGWV